MADPPHQVNLPEINPHSDGVSLLYYIEQRFSAERDLINQAACATEKAILKAEAAQKSYDESHNGLLRTIQQQNEKGMSRTEIEGKIEGVSARIAELRREYEEFRTYRDRQEGWNSKGLIDRAQGEFNLTTLIALAALAVALFLAIKK